MHRSGYAFSQCEIKSQLRIFFPFNSLTYALIVLFFAKKKSLSVLLKKICEHAFSEKIYGFQTYHFLLYIKIKIFFLLTRRAQRIWILIESQFSLKYWESYFHSHQHNINFYMRFPVHKLTFLQVSAKSLTRIVVGCPFK